MRTLKPLIQVYESPHGLPIVVVRLETWGQLSEHLKTVFYACAMAPGRRFAFTLKLSPEVTEAALRSPKGQTAYLREQIVLELRAALPDLHISLVFWIEGALYDDGGMEPLHLHGAFEVPVAEPGLVDEFAGLAVRPEDGILDTIRDALRKAGGPLGKGGGSQVDIQPMYSPLCWMSYGGKHPLCTRELISHLRVVRGLPEGGFIGLVGATEDMRQRGPEYFEHVRLTGEWVHCFPPSPGKRRRITGRRRKRRR